jgi:hypothetical protein
VIRPGPDAIAAHACPDGVVIHCYTTTVPWALVFTRRYHVDDALEERATADAERAMALTNGSVCLVAYDGDSGERFPAAAWGAAS